MLFRDVRSLEKSVNVIDPCCASLVSTGLTFFFLSFLFFSFPVSSLQSQHKVSVPCYLSLRSRSKQNSCINLQPFHTLMYGGASSSLLLRAHYASSLRANVLFFFFMTTRVALAMYASTYTPSIIGEPERKRRRRKRDSRRQHKTRKKKTLMTEREKRENEEV